MSAAMEPRPLVVVAHPDDEIIWLAAAMSARPTVVAAFPDDPDRPTLTAGRLDVRAHYPVAGFHFLPLSQAGVVHQSDWLRRAPAPYGVTLSPSCPPDRARAYVANYGALVTLLRPHIREHSCIYTHNPWGEYGHEEHIQVFNAVTSLARDPGQSVWVWDGPPAWRLLADGVGLRYSYFGRRVRGLPRRRLRIDIPLYQSIKQLYMSCHAWTWAPAYEPPQPSTYLQVVRDGQLLVTPRRKAPNTSRLVCAAAYAAARGTRAVLGRGRTEETISLKSAEGG